MSESIKAAGVYRLDNGRYKATIKAMGEFAYLGCFSTYEEAAAVRLKAESIVADKFPGWKQGMNAANKSGVKGISYHKRDRRWMVHHKRRYIGSSERLSEAKAIMEKYLRKHNGN